VCKIPATLPAGMHALHELIEHLKEHRQRLVLANPSRRVQAQLQRVHILEEIGQEWIFVRTADAVKMCALWVRENPLHDGSDVADEAANGPQRSLSNERDMVDNGQLARKRTATSSQSSGLVEIVCSDSPGRPSTSSADAGDAALATRESYHTPPESGRSP
jgi:STAS domain